MSTHTETMMRLRSFTMLAGAGLLAALALSCSSEGEDDGQDKSECSGEGCSCIFTDECDSGLVCVDGACGPDPRSMGGASGDDSNKDGTGGSTIGAGGDGDTTDEPEGAAMGEACDVPTDCESSLCLAVDGGICTQACNRDACPDGWGCVRIGSAEFAQSWCQPTCSAEAEACNGRDDDCDAEIDEDFKTDGLYISDEHCGACGNDCSTVIQNAVSSSCELVDGQPVCVPGDCLPGYYRPEGVNQCVPLPTNLCQSCASDDDCLVPGSLCLDVAEGKACARSCATDSPYGDTCPSGYSCNDVGAGDMQCTPNSNSCICNAANEGLERSCGILTCTGTQTCVDVGGSFEFSACSADGLIPEVCDGEDNDCDGEVDEDFIEGGRYTQDEHCGSCNNNCLVRWNPDVYNAVGYCDTDPTTPVCAIDQCQSVVEDSITYDFVDANGDANDGCECKRVAGNLTVDEPDEIFEDGAGERIYPEAGADYQDENCDGIDGVEADALFVRDGNTGGTGTRTNPFATIAEALVALADPANTASYILVAGGDYDERVALTAGDRLYGGYSLDFSSRNIVAFPTRLVPTAPALGSGDIATVSADGVTGSRTVLSGFEIHGADITETPTAPGSAGDVSYAVRLLDCDDGVKLSNNRIVGGSGGSAAGGSDGSKGYGRLSAGGDSLNGGDGANENQWCTQQTCDSGDTLAGGTAGLNSSCPSANGLAGGSSVCPVYDQPSYTPADPSKDGVPGTSWILDSDSTSACGSHVTEAGFPAGILTRTGGDGAAGDNGSAGLQGTGCSSADGSFVGGVWTPGVATSGATGAHGERGGIGASAGGIDDKTASMPAGVDAYTGTDTFMLGATGGGAAAGGCGGTAGGLGGTGGASIAVFVGYTSTSGISAVPSVSANLISRGIGGSGGNGGFGGLGGLGGIGGDRGESLHWAEAPGGQGGRGGQGGTAGGGGGGCGGPSFGVVVADADTGWALTLEDDNQFLQSDSIITGGLGGQVGPTGMTNASGDGTDGSSANYFQQ